MSIIKDIYDVAKEGASQASKIGAVKRALRTEAKLNLQFLMDVSLSLAIDDERRVEIIKNLETVELAAAVRYELPYLAISRKKVTKTLAENYKIKRIQGYDLEKLIESLFLMITYLKKDFKNKRIDLNLRLININKYNNLLLELLK
ncbi:hypothetical protein [Winogradskyella alexanderae]|uniref:Uncharacterized protein n=1 Tax=Winogradskyella alexanderae TaxID=2877123 RepID=A0ABS7XPG9_9FLAO|nr:hypothetical protein [Winogradskyella alexanderae]MCA0131908.1 hypothetical protein [Winogradskyella alexanderae]